MNDERDGLTPAEREKIERVTRRAREAHDRFVRELDGLLYDLRTYTERQRQDRPPPPARRPHDERGASR